MDGNVVCVPSALEMVAGGREPVPVQQAEVGGWGKCGTVVRRSLVA